VTKPIEHRRDGFLRLPDIIGPNGLIPISRSTWWAGIKDGRFPKGVKLSPRATAWRAKEIYDLIDRLGDGS
jgi:predicted DNA-binding transcriptional regulator AlpA